MKLRIALFAVCSVGLPSVPVFSQIQITEVMADPPGSEFRNEYVELMNLGDHSIRLDGWSIGDGSSSDALVFASEDSLDPGQICLVVDPDYDGGRKPYGGFPDDILIATIADGTFGSAGLNNVIPERVSLIDQAGDTVAAITYRIGPEGHSYEAIVSLDEDLSGWEFSKTRGGTPGFTNSVSENRLDVALALFAEPPETLAGGTRSSVDLIVQNLGGDDEEMIKLVLSWSGGESRMTLEGPLARGIVDTVTMAMPPIIGAREEFRVEADLEGDQDDSNNAVEWSVLFGVEALDVVINEVMLSPRHGPEWIEILNRTDQPVFLDGWTLTDDSGRAGRLPDLVLPSGGYAVLASEREILPDGWLAVAGWPTLNNGRDRIILKDGSGAVIDEMLYEGSALSGRSLERIDSSSGSTDSENWLSNGVTIGGTPGRQNGAKLATADLTVLAEPDPFDDQTTLSVTLPHPRSSVILQVFDRRGRLRRRLLTGVEVGSSFSVSWDGRDDGGQSVRPGVYVVYLEASGSERKVIRNRSLVIYAKGL